MTHHPLDHTRFDFRFPLLAYVFLPYLDVFPREHDLLGRLAEQADVPPPRVEVGRVGLHVAVRVSDAVSVENELFGKGRWLANKAR